MSGAFTETRVAVDGLQTMLLEAGAGEPLVFFHGAGTWTGFDFARAWAERFRVLIPFHPGFGPSDDDTRVEEMHDYVLHYLDWMDALKLGPVHLVGHSLGGWLAARFAIEHGHRIRRLVLVSPAGLRVPAHPTADLFRIPDEKLPPMLVANPEVLRTMMPPGSPDVEFIVARYRERTSLARVMWERNWDRTLSRWLHRIRVPTLFVWGAEDQLIPAAQADVWAREIPGARISLIPGAGHLVLHESPGAASVIRDFLEGGS